MGHAVINAGSLNSASIHHLQEVGVHDLHQGLLLSSPGCSQLAALPVLGARRPVAKRCALHGTVQATTSLTHAPGQEAVART